MSIRRGRSQRETEAYVAASRARDDEQHRRELAQQAAREAAERRIAADRAEKEQKRNDRADEILAMTPDEHRQKAAYFLAVAEDVEWDRRPYFLGKANAHLGFAATAQRGDER